MKNLFVSDDTASHDIWDVDSACFCYNIKVTIAVSDEQLFSGFWKIDSADPNIAELIDLIEPLYLLVLGVVNEDPIFSGSDDFIVLPFTYIDNAKIGKAVAPTPYSLGK